MYYEKIRNEIIRNRENPFEFGTIVEEEYFTDRVQEVAYNILFAYTYEPVTGVVELRGKRYKT